jgi:putative transposase
MQQIITAKLKLLATPEQHHLLRQTQLAYRDSLNYVSRYAFAQGKTSNTEPDPYARLQKTLAEERHSFRHPAQDRTGRARETVETAVRRISGRK